MTAMLGKEDKSALVSQCLDFCQTLATKSLTFSFTLTLGDSFSFSVDTSGKEALVSKAKKKKTPSTLRRNARRRAEFLKKKLEDSTGDASSHREHVSVEEAVGKQAEKVVDKTMFKCDQCDNIFKSENGLKIHVGKSHKKVNPLQSTPDQLRQQLGGSVSLSASHLLDTSREEFCSNFDFECGSCYFKCSDGEALKIHRSSVHQLPRKCSVCDLVFQDFVSLGAHIKVHMGIESDSD